MMVSEFPKHLRKLLSTDCVKYNITNRLQHRKCVRLEMSINTHPHDSRHRNLTKEKFNNHLEDIIINKAISRGY